MDWIRGKKLGHGSFATVSLAAVQKGQNFPPLIAVKTCGASHASSLLHEKSILQELQDCPEVITCYGESFSCENGEKLYNVLLEYASGGSLSDRVKNSGTGKLPENEIRQYTKALLKGLDYVHKMGYVHCDIKLDNILLSENGGLKIADFGLAKRAGAKAGAELRGTPVYMSPEMVAGGDQGPAADVWAVGCAVVEMASGATPWRRRRSGGVAEVLMRIGKELPEVPGCLSDEGRDFLSLCFEKDSSRRWTAEMLLDHPFVCEGNFGEVVGLKDENETSPRCPFDFPDWVSSDSCSTTFLPLPECGLVGAAARLRRVASGEGPDWSVLEDWITVR